MSSSFSGRSGDKASESGARRARRELLERIGEFMMKHDLNVTGTNLAAVGTALSGSNAELAQAFAAREISGEPIDQRWLDTVVRLDPQTGERVSELEKLMDRMEYALMRFAQTARTAHHETSEHRGALGEQIKAMTDGDIDQSPEVGMAMVIDLSNAMLERLTQIESAMERSQSESDQLRASLAEARIEADVDHLTRLPNRRAFERRLASAAQEAQDKGDKLCVAFCDVDNFKTINDTHGHDAGDRVLISIAGTLNRYASDECFVARHGGEEFVLLFFRLDKDAAWSKLDCIRRAQGMKQLINRQTGKPFGKVTFSGGITEVRGPQDTRDALIRADEALYQAKGAGRDRIVAI
jgi:diguanylate cyclase